MEFRLPGFNAQHNQVYSYSTPNFSNHPMEQGRGPVDLHQREAIQRELDKEMIREKIIAEELDRFRVLQAQSIRRELMMPMRSANGNGFASSALLVGYQSSGEITNSFLKADHQKPNLPVAGKHHHHHHYY